MEIVNVIEISSDVLGYFFCIAVLLFVILAIQAIKEKVPEAGILAVIVAFGFCIASYFAFISEPTEQYEVLITDFNEVYEQGYEIVDQRGDIYTVQKKED